VKASVELSAVARKALKRLARTDRRLYERVDRALDLLAEDPALGKNLQGVLSGRRSYRVGSLRIIYRFESECLVVYVLDPGQRGRIYRGET
jgi:mRNA-degrading endonuclease RelE of RelBE toxin-antitoxin system